MKSRPYRLHPSKNGATHGFIVVVGAAVVLGVCNVVFAAVSFPLQDVKKVNVKTARAETRLFTDGQSSRTMLGMGVLHDPWMS